MLIFNYSGLYEEEGMKKLFVASMLLFILSAIQNQVFAGSIHCKFKDRSVAGVESIQLTDDNLVINKNLEIPLEKSRVICGHFGRQTRFDGEALGYQVVLKSCTTEATLEGHIIDSVNEIAADLVCDQDSQE
jgi:hypothetical protein